MQLDEPVVLSRSCEAIQIPAGIPVTLEAGASVTITQALGGTYTVLTEFGLLVRIDAKDVDALGERFLPASGESSDEQELSLEEKVYDQLKTCYDPEIPVNIVDLGLIYGCQITSMPEGGEKVEIKMTLTAPGCGMGEVLRSDITKKILGLRGVRNVDVDVIFDPPWDRSMMSEAAKLQCGM